MMAVVVDEDSREEEEDIKLGGSRKGRKCNRDRRRRQRSKKKCNRIGGNVIGWAEAEE